MSSHRQLCFDGSLVTEYYSEVARAISWFGFCGYNHDNLAIRCVGRDIIKSEMTKTEMIFQPIFSSDD